MAMDDTRLWEWLDDVTDLMQRVRAFGEENIKAPQDRMDVQSALHLLSKFHSNVTGLMPAGWLCLNHSSYGSTCYRGRGHEGPHMSEWGHTWTDQSDAAAAKQIVASMKGKTE